MLPSGGPSRRRPGFPPSHTPTSCAGGVATAAGYGFTETRQPLDTAARCVVVGTNLPDLRREKRRGRRAMPAPGQRHIPKVYLSGASDCMRDPAPAIEGGLKLAIGLDQAYVGVDPSAWPFVAEPVLLTVSLCWRFSAIAEELDQLVNWSRDTCRRPGGSWFQGRLAATSLTTGSAPSLSRARSALLRRAPDRPSRLLRLIRAARLFQALVKRLELNSWRALLDERVEIVEATLEALAEERRHHAG